MGSYYCVYHNIWKLLSALVLSLPFQKPSEVKQIHAQYTLCFSSHSFCRITLTKQLKWVLFRFFIESKQMIHRRILQQSISRSLKIPLKIQSFKHMQIISLAFLSTLCCLNFTIYFNHIYITALIILNTLMTFIKDTVFLAFYCRFHFLLFHSPSRTWK